MSSLVTVKKEVEKLKERLALKHRVDLVVIMFFGDYDEPHGKYGIWKLHVHKEFWKDGQQCEEPTLQEQLTILRDRWEENGHRQYSGDDHPQISFEEFLKEYECKCGRHGEKLQKPDSSNHDLENEGSVQFLPGGDSHERD